jgi:hypothetical protein
MLIVALFYGILSGVIHSTELFTADHTLQFIENCMDRSPAPWPDEWKLEYIGTIRKVVEYHQDATHYALRLKILREGFASSWEGLTKSKDRALFDVYRCRMQWYIEHLMGTGFPTDQERQKLRDQYTEIWNYAADSLLEQFQFLDPNTVRKGMHDDLNVCYRKIDVPLIPVYLRPLSAEQVERIKQCWDKLRYDRVDLWRRLSGEQTTFSDNCYSTSRNVEHDYQLTKESLSQLLGLVWMVVPQRPDYYLRALENRSKALEQRVQSRRTAQAKQQSLEIERSRQLPQTERISFMFAALLEISQNLDK